MVVIALVLCFVVSLAGFSSAQEETKTVSPRAPVGVGIKISSFGAGAEVALRLFSHSNLRAGFNYFLYDHDLGTSGGAGYRGELNLCSAQATYDWYPFHGGFHVGPTVLAYNASHVHAKVAVPGGNVFTITNNSYQSDPSDPIRGTASMSFPKLAPGFLVGWGNLAGRRRHFVVPFELGFIFEGVPHVSLNLTGTGCDVSGLGCSSLGSDPAAVSAIHAEQQKIAREVTFLRFYPVVSLGLGYSF